MTIVSEIDSTLGLAALDPAPPPPGTGARAGAEDVCPPWTKTYFEKREKKHEKYNFDLTSFNYKKSNHITALLLCNYEFLNGKFDMNINLR